MTCQHKNEEFANFIFGKYSNAKAQDRQYGAYSFPASHSTHSPMN